MQLKLFDSHCHIDDKSFETDFDAMLARFHQAGGRALLVAGIDSARSQRGVRLARTHAPIYASVGFHPHDARNCNEDKLQALIGLAREPKVCAWGEIGLDFNRQYSPRTDQERWFIRQLEITDQIDLPIILHERDSGGRLLEILRQQPNADRRAVVHCFSGTRQELSHYLEMGFYIGITGILTIAKRGGPLRSLATHIPADRLLIETDAPYLTPAPEKNRTRRNEPAFVRSTLLKLAEVRGDDPEILAETAWNNTCRLFGIGGQES